MRRLLSGDVIELFDPIFLSLVQQAFPPDDMIHHYTKPFVVENPCNVGRDMGRQIELFQGCLSRASEANVKLDMILAATETYDFSPVVALAQTIKARSDLWGFYVQWSNALHPNRRAKEGEPRCDRDGCILYQSPGSRHTHNCYNGEPIPYPTLVFPQLVSIPES